MNHPHNNLEKSTEKINQDSSERKIYIITIVLNLVYMSIEIAVGLWQNSLALIADASHNLTDVLNILIVWLGVWMANRPSSPTRTYGFRRASLLSSMYIGISMVGAATAIGWSGIDRFTSQNHSTLSGGLLMGVASVGIVINLVSAWLFMRKNRESSDINDKALSMELFYDGFVSALVVLGGLFMSWFGWQWVDSVLAIVVAVFILWSAFRLVGEVLNLLMDAVPSHINADEVRALILAHPGVMGLHDLHIWAMSARHISLSAHVTAENGLSDEAHSGLWHKLSEHFGIEHITIQVEKDETRCPQIGHTI